ncbi:uncharacterized protein EI90DRAFT_3025480 [Cantharellus anzutake]|uniref:uncharacterized protein n=1 Tax=Cantharellus anzutake TaxID=1750568 RepID=UPI0019081AAC|nr:uncharacterized protein EI90DRAFT_3025480 [Cantharellus anzutake]KAF8309064.1 hypothetical protein EI90DRAFT_3025480 [Cantharellus anzutake]
MGSGDDWLPLWFSAVVRETSETRILGKSITRTREPRLVGRVDGAALERMALIMGFKNESVVGDAQDSFLPLSQAPRRRESPAHRTKHDTQSLSTTTRLVFWVFGDGYDRTIGVDIALNRDVEDLKKAIKEEIKKALEHVGAEALVKFDDNFEEALNLTERPLSGRRELGPLFLHKSPNAARCLDIVVIPSGAFS